MVVSGRRIRPYRGPVTSKVLKIELYGLRQKYSPKNLVFSDVSFTAIFVEVTDKDCIIERHL